jgi:hypothetical protein
MDFLNFSVLAAEQLVAAMIVTVAAMVDKVKV